MQHAVQVCLARCITLIRLLKLHLYSQLHRAKKLIFL